MGFFDDLKIRSPEDHGKPTTSTAEKACTEGKASYLHSSENA